MFAKLEKFPELIAQEDEKRMQEAWQRYFQANKLYPKRDPNDKHVMALHEQFLRAKAAYKRAYKSYTR